MRILVLQLKRIGDLVLTTAALRALRNAWPEVHLGLAVMEGCAPLLECISTTDTNIVFGPGRGWAPWQQVLTGGWDICLDLTGNDRSAAATLLSRARKKLTYQWVARRKLRALAYNGWCDSSVRDRHTTDHYLDLAHLAASLTGGTVVPTRPELTLPQAAQETAHALLGPAKANAPYVLLHPGTARPEKYWVAERWAAVADWLWGVYGLNCIITSGPDAFERDHVNQINAHLSHPGSVETIHPPDLATLAAVVQGAKMVISADTAVVHLASAFQRPQIALFGPTNPYHWRPQHERAVVLSAAHPAGPLTDFQPRMKGAPTDGISTQAVIGATEGLLAGESPLASPS